MTWSTHAALAMSSLWLLWAVEPQAVERSAGVLVLVAVLGGLFPDLDAPTSKLQRLPLLEQNIAPFALVSQGVRLASAHLSSASSCGSIWHFHLAPPFRRF